MRPLYKLPTMEEVKKLLETPSTKVLELLDNKPFKNIRMVGMEIEGGWWDRPYDFKPDPSVTIANMSNCEFMGEDGHDECEECGGGDECEGYSGEVASPPYDTYRSLMEWGFDNWCNKWNHTCGLHVHISFTSLEEHAIRCSRVFTTHFIRSLEGWTSEFGGILAKLRLSHDWLDGYRGRLERLGSMQEDIRGLRRRIQGSTYCQRGFIGDEQLKRRTSRRYSQLNFLAYHAHKTLEVRVLPQCGFKLGCILVKVITEIVDDFDSKALRVGVKSTVPFPLIPMGKTQTEKEKIYVSDNHNREQEPFTESIRERLPKQSRRYRYSVSIKPEKERLNIFS